jgi:hypothetical protein
MEVLIVLSAILMAVFWRSALRIVLTIVAIILVVLITSGAIVLLDNLHHVIK